MDALDRFNAAIATLGGMLWHTWVLYILLASGTLFTLWSRLGQVRSLTHGVAVVAGRYSDARDPGAISHFQALSAALSATVGLGNIGGVALAIGLGGPGAVFWMWVVGVLGMAFKSTEVTLSMLYRNTDDPKNPSGGPMWVARKGFRDRAPWLARIGRGAAGLFCVTLLISTVTGGNLYQAWNVGNVTQTYFGIPSWVAGIVLAVLVALVILGGVARIGAVAGRLVPLMCGAYLLAALYVIVVRIDQLPAVVALIFQGAFDGVRSQGAFLGGTAAFAFSIGLQRAFFSNEAGQGSSPIAHSAARTDEPAREGIVAGLEPFIDTLVICTLTALVILLSGVWNRPPDLAFSETPSVIEAAPREWTLDGGTLSPRADRAWRDGDVVQVHVAAAGRQEAAAQPVPIAGTVRIRSGEPVVDWSRVVSQQQPVLVHGDGYFVAYSNASFTALAFDQVRPGLGKWLVTVAVWLFALSTLISWSYYGEQGWAYLFGARRVTLYRLLFCALIPLACAGIFRTATELNNMTAVGTGAMLFVNVPITLFFARQAIEAQRDYVRRMRRADGRASSQT